jgi:deleted-in-malignant-brain-tumors protein 1
VACRQLGFSTTGAVALSGFMVPDGTGQIWLDDIRCRGTETRLIDCPARPLAQNNCGHGEDAGVRCSATTTTTSGNLLTNFSIALINTVNYS